MRIEDIKRVLIYKRTHNDDPDQNGCFGVEDCMGIVRNRRFADVRSESPAPDGGPQLRKEYRETMKILRRAMKILRTAEHAPPSRDRTAKQDQPHRRRRLMIIRYTPCPVRTGVPVLGGTTLVPRPILALRITGPSGSRLRDGLLDTGADETIVDPSVAPLIGVDLSHAPER